MIGYDTINPMRAGQPRHRAWKPLVIAAGTPHQTMVRDVRGEGRWATASVADTTMERRRIVFHHTADGYTGHVDPLGQLAMMELMRGQAPWGLPYNFIVFPNKGGRIWYLNDVDKGWPHTYGGNDATAIAGWGNYMEEEAPAVLVARMLRLADALASMWGRWIPEYQHRDFTPTKCPGSGLYGLLPREGRQRGA